MATSVDEEVGPRPLSVSEIIEQASQFEYNPSIRLLYLLRSADTILKEAQIYEREGNDQKAFLLLYRHAQFVINKLANHPEAGRKENRIPLADANNAVSQNMAKLEAMKPRINQRYLQYRDHQIRLASSRKRQSTVLEGSGKTRVRSSRDASTLSRDMDGLSLESPAKTDPAMYGAKETLRAGDNRDLALKLAHSEIKRRDQARRSVRQAGVTEEQEQERRTAGLWGNWETELVRDSRHRNHSSDQQGDDLSKSILEARRRGDETIRRGRRTQDQSSGAAAVAARSQIHYPTVKPQSSPSWNAAFANNVYSPVEDLQSPSRMPPELPLKPQRPPPLPSKDTEYVGAPVPSLRAPPLPAKVPGSDTSEAVSRSTSATPPQQQPLMNSGLYTFKPSAYLENGTPLRTIFIPPTLRNQFLKIASPNTSRNLETCGMLCGTLISNALFISKLVIPKQESTSDTCEMTDESELFDYVDKEDLMVLGWIHTHPTQTCFMSSRDLHTHSGFQAMMSESIAIVCAPSKDPSWGAFRLTDPPGMRTVLQCTQTGVFHPHGEENIYTDAMKPGHVCELPGLDFDIEDLRLKR